MQFGAAVAMDAAATPSGAARSGRRIVDLAAFTPASTPRRGRWRHSIRHVDAKGRVRVGEMRALQNDHGHLSAAMSPEGWMLGPDRGAAWRVAVDDRGRVAVPLGVRRQMGLSDMVVVSVEADRSRVVIWSAARLDQLLGVLS